MHWILLVFGLGTVAIAMFGWNLDTAPGSVEETAHQVQPEGE